MPFVTSAAIAFGTFVGKLTGSFFLAHAAAWVLKAGALFAANALLTARSRTPEAPTLDRVEAFSSGPARWVLGRRKVGGVVMFWGEDWDVKGTEGGGGPGADDLHLIIAVSAGTCDAIEAIFVAGERLDVKFNDSAKTEYRRRGARTGDSEAALEELPLDLDPGAPTWWDPSIERYRISEGGRLLDRDDEADAELIRRADLSGSVNVVPWLDGSESDRWRSVRVYKDRADTAVLETPTHFTDWSSDHRLDGIAGLHIRLRQWTKHDFDERIFKAGVPALQFLIRGQRITHPDPDASTGSVTRWTNNAAAVRYWWHTQRRGIPTAAIDRAAFVSAYQACEERITPSLPDVWPSDEPPDWAEDTETLSFRRYSIDGVVTSGESPADIEAGFDDAWQGFVVEDGGSLHYYPGIDRIEQPTAIDGAYLLEFPTWQPAPSHAERVNAVSLSIEQSSFHDFNDHALREIVDASKREEVDEDLHLPHDLGSWRWTINPAQAYSLATITLRRARRSGTLSIKLPPGTDDDPIAYLTMSPGLIYTLDMPEEGFDGARMLLIDKQVDETMAVSATFTEAPIGLYAPAFQLPDVAPPPTFIPSRPGWLPPKPTGLAVEHSAQVSSDGSVQFRIVTSVDASPRRTIFRLTAGDDRWEIETASNTHTFVVNTPRVQMEVTARSIDKTGSVSLPARLIFTPNYERVALPRPIWEDVIVYGGSLRLVFDRLAWGASISGVEVRYTRLPLGSTSTPVSLTPATWDSASVLRTEAVQVVRGLDINVNAIASESGRYALFARFVSQVSGAEPVRGPLSALREIEIDIPEQPITTIEEAPLFAGGKTHLDKWVGQAGDAAGEALLFPSSTPASALRFDHWNGYVPDSSITAHPLPRWPFGQCEGFGSALTATRDSFGIIQSSASTTYTTNPIDLGVSKRVDVKAEIFAYTPGTALQSNLTFGSHSIVDQVWGSGAITAITLPEASNGVGSIAYRVDGLPAGVTFTASTRIVSGTPLISTAQGSARYVATDGGGGEAVIEFGWSISSTLSAPAAPTGLAVSVIQPTTARLTWTASANASTYTIERRVAAGTWSVIASAATEATFDLTGLTAATAYEVRIRARNGAGASGLSAVRSFTTAAAPTAPGTPTGLAVEARTSSTITIDWTAGNDVTSYEVRWKFDTASNYEADHIATGITSTEHTITGLGGNQAFDIQVRARNPAGGSDWSSALDASTLAASYSAPTIATLQGFDAVRDYLQLTINTYTNLAALDIEVTADPSDGVHGSTAVIYTESPPGPYQIYNVKVGHTYSVRVRAELDNGAKSVWSTASAIVLGDRPSAIRSPSVTMGQTSAALAWTAPASGSPTSYRVDYWKDAEPTNVLYVDSITGTSRTITGLDAGTAYTFSISSFNAGGQSLGVDVEGSTSAAPLAAPSAPTNRISIPVSTTDILLDWSDVDGATTYEVRHAKHPYTDFSTITTGLTSSLYTFRGLTPGVRYRPQVRAKNSAGESAWVNFPEVVLPTASSDFSFDTAAPLTLSTGTGRDIAWTFSASVDSGVSHFQIRYRQSQDALTDDNVVPDWVILTDVIANTHASGQRTFSGSFDPGYSRRYYEVQVRAYIDSNVGSSVGLSEWAPASNSVNLSNPTRTLSGVILNGATTLPALAFTLEQRSTNPITIRANLAKYPIDEIEPPGSSVHTFTYQITDVGTNANRTFDINTQLVNSNLNRITQAEGVDFAPIAGRSGFVIGSTYRVELSVAKNPQIQSSNTSHTIAIVDPDTIASTAPAQPGVISVEREDSDVTFSWASVPGASGYEVRLIEEDVGALDGTLEYVAQTGAGTEYEKIGGRNEHFRISVRAYAGAGSNRLYSTPRTFDYSPSTDAHSVGKVTGIEEDPIGSTTRIRWRSVPNADGYEYQTTTNEGWSAAQTTTLTFLIVNSVGSFTIRIRGYRGTGADRVYGLSWTALAHREDTNPGGGQIGDVEYIAAIDRSNDVTFDWDNLVPNAGRFRIERRAAGGATWALVQANISNVTTAWATDDDASVSATYRIRGETDEGNGAWTELEWSGSTLLPLGSISDVRVIAYATQLTPRWDFPTGIFQAEVEYRKGSSGSWTAVSVNRYAKHVTIEGLDSNAAYQVRVRAKSGERVGAWTTSSVQTLQCVTLAAPSSLTLSVKPAADGWGVIAVWERVIGASVYEVHYATKRSVTSPWGNSVTRYTNLLTSEYVRSPPPMSYRVRVRAVGAGGCLGAWSTARIHEPSTQSTGAQASAEGAIAAGTGAVVNIPAVYSAAGVEPVSAFARPFFDGYFEERCFVSGSAIDSFTIPAPLGGVPPYTITITGLPTGVTFDADTRSVSGTPSVTAPAEGYALVRLEDEAGGFETRSIRWIVGSAVPQSWSEFGGGFGAETNPFQIECTTRGNVRPFYFRSGGTNAADIANGVSGASGVVLWLRCPTTYAHTARLLGADAPDYDLVVKVGTEYHFSDSTDAIEFVRVEGDPDGALIGIYRYSSTTTTTGVNNTGDPLILEWYPDVIDAPTDSAGDEVSGAVGESGVTESGAEGNTGRVPGQTETEVYLLHRNGKTGAWTRRATALAAGWTDIGVNAREIRFEFHLKRWENRAVRRLTSFHRDRS